MKLKKAIKSAKRIEIELQIGKASKAIKVTKKDASLACHNYLETESFLDCEWRDENDEIIARLFCETLSIGS